MTPSYRYLKMWECFAKVPAPLPKKTKLGSKTVDCIFLCYVLNSSAYSFLVHKSEILNMHVHMIIELREVFFEDIFSIQMERNKTSETRTYETAFRDERPSEPTANKEIELRRSKRSRISKSFGPSFIAYAIESKPRTFKEVMSISEAQMWKEAVTGS